MYYFRPQAHWLRFPLLLLPALVSAGRDKPVQWGPCPRIKYTRLVSECEQMGVSNVILICVATVRRANRQLSTFQWVPYTCPNPLE